MTQSSLLNFLVNMDNENLGLHESFLVSPLEYDMAYCYQYSIFRHLFVGYLTDCVRVYNKPLCSSTSSVQIPSYLYMYVLPHMPFYITIS